jgi:hypothetical protein
MIKGTKSATLKYPKRCIVLGLLLIAYAVTAVGVIVIVHLKFVDFGRSGELLRTHVMCGGFGMLGASLATIRKYYKALITDVTLMLQGATSGFSVWTLGWIYYYITRPILGGLLGALTYTLSYVGFRILATSTNIEISAEGKYALYGVSLLAGYSVSHVLDVMSAVSKQVFRGIWEQEK